MQNLGRKAFFLAQQSQQQVLGPNMLMRKTFGLFGRVCQNPFTFVAEGKIDGSRHLLADGRVAFDLLADRFHRRVGAQEPVGQGLVFSQQPEQQVFGFNIRRAELAGLIPGKKDNAPGFLRVAFKHIAHSPQGFPRRDVLRQTLPDINYAFISLKLLSDIRPLVT
jgi:hypothetical protein